MTHGRFGTSMGKAVRAGERGFVGGQSGFTPDGDYNGNGDPAAQAEQAMRNIRALIEQAGASMAHLRRITTSATARARGEAVDAVLQSHFGSPGPARVGLIVAGLAVPEMLVQIDA